jgi:hypothetical protein
MASQVGQVMIATPRRWASVRTSSITGKLPCMPVPITSRLQSHGMASFRDNGVWPDCLRNSGEAFFFRLRVVALRVALGHYPAACAA